MQNRQQHVIQKYLHNSAELGPLLSFSETVDILRQYVIVIPAYNEKTHFIERLSMHPESNNILLIIVLNEPQGSENNELNRFLKTWLETHSNIIEKTHAILYGKIAKLSFLLLDHCNERALPQKKAVGMARKIGADLSAWLINKRKITSKWIYCSDADAHLPDNYFSAEIKSSNNSAALVYNFEHFGSSTPVLEATRIYESQIRAYRQWLQEAGSPYAFFTLGSCMTLSMPHYCQARGFPKKAAGEDFYLLNKLAKIDEITFISDIFVKLEARLSDRVPFGTGPSVKKIMNTINANQDITYYNPQIFHELARVLESIDFFMLNPRKTLLKLPSPCREALESAGITAFIHTRLKQDKTSAQFKKSFHSWFDAFQTLKFVHHLQETHYSPVSFVPT